MAEARPRVTQIIRAVGLGVAPIGIAPAVLEAARARGAAVHAAIELHGYGALEPSDVAPETKPYLDAYERFVADYAHEPIVSEYEVVHPGWDYCFPPGSLVMVERGAVPIEELTLSDRVIDMQGVLNPISGLACRAYSGPLVSIGCRKMLGPIISTPDHQIMTGTVTRRWNPMRREIANVAWKAAADIQVGDWLVVPRLSAVSSIPPLEDPTLAYFYGRFVGDGSTTLYREAGAERGRCRVTFGLSEWSDVEHLRGVIARYGPVRLIRQDSVMHLEFGRTQLAREFRTRFGAGAPTKRVPPEIMGASPKVVRAFLRGYYDADGWRHRNAHEASTVSPGLALQLQLMMTTLGILATIHRRGEAGMQEICGRTSLRRDRWLVRIGATDADRAFDVPVASKYHRRTFYAASATHFAVPVAAVDRIEYTGPVYDISCGGSFLVNNLVVHNCGHLDRVGWVKGNRRVLIDWKTGDGVDLESVALQLAGYELAWSATRPGEPLEESWAVQLKSDGNYVVHRVATSRAKDVFLAALVVYGELERRGLLL